MIAALLLAAAAPTAIDAERAFAADAQQIGQWTAFRKWATHDAVMFAPQAVWAQDYLKDAKDPAKALEWAPADNWVACDGRTAINRGPWSAAGSTRHGYFTTVWMHGEGNWRWIYDGGDVLAEPMPRPKKPRVVRASCRNLSKIAAAYRAAVKPTERIAGQAPADAGQGRSADGTLLYEWRVQPDGARRFAAKLWNGRAYDVVIDQSVAAPPLPPTQ